MATSGNGAGASAAPDRPDALRRLGEVLHQCAASELTGVVSVAGEPGGTIHLTEGMVSAIETPGAPGPEVLLLRSGRVPEPGWSAAFTAAAAAGRMGEELTRRELAGAGELEALLRLALADAMFVLAAGELGECTPAADAADCLLPLDPPAGPAWLLGETSRRFGVLASLPAPIDHGRDRWTAARGAPAAGGLGGGRDAILALASGRRTARDIAFALGRGVYAVTLELARMQADGLLVPAARRQAAPRGGQGQPAAGSSGARDGGQAAPLPRRRRGQAQPRRSRPAAGQDDRAALLRLLRPAPAADQDP